jgi:hypothetical protein
MKRIFFYFLFITLNTTAFSQLGPGYMGKRFQAGYGFYFSPALLGSNGSGASIIGRGNAESGEIAFNSMHEGFLEFAFKNRASVGLSFKYYHTTFDNSAEAYGTTNGSSGTVYTAYGTPSGIYDIKGLNFGLYFKIYNKRYVAPWGRYFLFGPVVNSYACFYDPSVMKMVTQDNSSNPVAVTYFGPQGDRFFRGDLLIGWGRNRMIGSRFTVDYGVNFEGFALACTFWDAIGESPLADISGDRTTNLNYMEKTSKRRAREVNRVNVYIRFGVLLF